MHVPGGALYNCSDLVLPADAHVALSHPRAHLPIAASCVGPARRTVRLARHPPDAVPRGTTSTTLPFAPRR